MKSKWAKKEAGQLKFPSLTAAFIFLFVFLFIFPIMPCVKPVAEAEINDWDAKEANYSPSQPNNLPSKKTAHLLSIGPQSSFSLINSPYNKKTGHPSTEPAFSYESRNRSSSAKISVPLSSNLSPDSAYFQEAHRQIRSKVQALLTSQRFRRTQFSISIRWAGTGEAIFEHQAHGPMIPASNMKLVTSAAALNFLGPDFEFRTLVGLVGQSLVIIGSGDPLFGDKEIDKHYGRQPNWILEDISSRLSIKGVKSIQDIILDTSIFDDQRVHPSWPENALLQKYACEVSGVNYNGNCVDLSVVNRHGKTFLILEPKTSYLHLINETVATHAAENWFSVSRGASPKILRVTGKVRTQAGPYAVAVANPALFFGTILKEHLTKKGITVEGEVKEEPISAEDELELVAEYRTHLFDVLRRVNKDSLGLAAEALVKTLGAKENPEGKGGSWEKGTQVITRFLLQLSIPENEFFIADGSGLSRDNRLTSHVLTSLLTWLYRQALWPAFESTLAVGGVDGTLESVFRERILRGRVLAKTGYINGVRALSGIAHTKSGDIIFSFLANNASNAARITINNIVKEITVWADSLLTAASVTSLPRTTRGN